MNYFSAKNYLNEYYADLSSENKSILRFFARVAPELKGYGNHLELGCGPTICQVISIAPYVHKIIYTDAYQESFDEVNAWLKNDHQAFNWQRYIRYALQAEGIVSPTKRDVARREEELRKKIKIRMLDVSSANELIDLFQTHEFSSVSSVFALEVVATDAPHLMTLFSILRSGLNNEGVLSVVMVLGGNQYKVGTVYLPNLKITAKELQGALTGAGFSENKIAIEEVVADRSHYGYEGIALVRCVK